MATKIQGKNVWLYYQDGTKLDTDGVTEIPNWLAFACSTSDGFSGSTETTNTATKCSGNWVENEDGDKSWEFSSSCYAIKDPTAEQASHKIAFQLWKAGDLKTFKIATIDDTYIRQGQGRITSYSETADRTDSLQFELTVTGHGEVMDEDDLAPAV